MEETQFSASFSNCYYSCVHRQFVVSGVLCLRHSKSEFFHHQEPSAHWFPETFYLREIFPPRLKDMTGKKIIHFSFFHLYIFIEG